MLKIQCFSIKGSERTGLIQPTKVAIYFFSAPSVPLNFISQSNQASVFKHNLTPARKRGKKSFMLICLLSNLCFTAPCFHKRAQDEVCGVLTPTMLSMTAQQLLAVMWHLPCVTSLHHHGVLYLQCYDHICSTSLPDMLHIAASSLVLATLPCAIGLPAAWTEVQTAQNGSTRHWNTC